jgi:hypothetical protein
VAYFAPQGSLLVSQALDTPAEALMPSSNPPHPVANFAPQGSLLISQALEAPAEPLMPSSNPPHPVAYFAPQGSLLISQALDTPAEPLMSSSNTPLDSSEIPLEDRKTLLSKLNMRLNHELSETLLGELGPCSRDEEKSPAEEIIAKALEELDWVRKRFMGLSRCLGQASLNLTEIGVEQRENIEQLARELGEVQEKERETQGKLSANVLKMIEKGKSIREEIEARRKASADIQAQIDQLQTPIIKPPKVVICDISISKTGSLKAQVFLRSFHSCPAVAHIYNYTGHSCRINVVLTPGNNPCELGPYHVHPREYLGLIFEKEDSTPLGEYWNFLNELSIEEQGNFEDTLVARNFPQVAEIERKLSSQGKEILRTLAVAWKNPTIELVDHFLATIRSREEEGLMAVCWRLRNTGLLFAGLGF